MAAATQRPLEARSASATCLGGTSAASGSMGARSRSAAEWQHAQDKREERSFFGQVRFAVETKVPDIGGVGWRTKAGHMLKNQGFYPSKPGVNDWDIPGMAGPTTWQEWHGPRLRTDADMMERLDRFEEGQADWEAKKAFVNTTRAETLDRLDNRKVQRSQLEVASAWAPHRRASREVHSSFETFDSGMCDKPRKELQKVYTDAVVRMDREAVRGISRRFHAEETWKLLYKQMEQERRHDLRTDFKQRQAQNDRLMMLSGQRVAASCSPHESLNNCSQRSEVLARPRAAPKPRDITAHSDFRGLLHADMPIALETLFPGTGYELSSEFRSRITRSVEPCWPPPPPVETPRPRRRDDSEVHKLSVIRGSIPVASSRLENVATRSSEDSLRRYTKAQILPTVAPPAPDQRHSLSNEVWSPSSALSRSGRAPGEDLSATAGRFEAKDSAPPMRSYVYPVAVPASPSAQSLQARTSLTSSQLPIPGKGMRRHSSAPSLLSPSEVPAGQVSTLAVCRELDDFEANLVTIPRISNFFDTPRPFHHVSAGLSALGLAPASVPN